MNIYGNCAIAVDRLDAAPFFNRNDWSLACVKHC